MKKWFKTACILLLGMVPLVSCRQMYTTSLGSALARDSVTIPSNTSLSELVDLSKGSYAGDASAAKTILERVGEQKSSALLSLSVDDKNAILDLAPTAAVEIQTVTDLAKKVTAGGYDKNELIKQAFAAFDSSVDLSAIIILLSDPATVNTAKADSVILAAAVVLADVASELGSGGESAIMGLMSTPQVVPAVPLTTDQQNRVNMVIADVAILSARTDDAATVSIDDFKLLDLLKGNQP